MCGQVSAHSTLLFFICLNSVNLIKLKIETIPNWGISYYFIPNALNAASTGVEYTSKLN